MVSSDTGTIGAIRYEAPWGTLEAALTYEMPLIVQKPFGKEKGKPQSNGLPYSVTEGYFIFFIAIEANIASWIV